MLPSACRNLMALSTNRFFILKPAYNQTQNGHEQRCQSGLKSGELWTRVKKIRFFQANQRKISIFPGKLTKNFDFFSGKSFRMTFFSHLLQNVRLSRHYLPFTAKFQANYSILLEK